MAKFYTGIGSRDTPLDTLIFMEDEAFLMAEQGFTLRSGGANGADTAFEKGADKGAGSKEIYLPWRNFNKNTSLLYPPTKAAMEMAKSYHPAWERLNRPVRLLHARNCHQVLGLDLMTPSEGLWCWTLNGAIKGGTATAIKIAHDYNIPVVNFGAIR